MTKVVATVEGGIQEASLAAVNHFLSSRIFLTVKSLNVKYCSKVASGMAKSERQEQSGVTTPFENACEKIYTFPEFNLTDVIQV